MKKIILPFLLLPSLAFANPTGYTVGCKVKDAIGIRDAGEGKAIVTYYNSEERCSGGMDLVLTSQNGISVRVIVEVGPDEEFIVVIPLNEGMMSDPPEAYVIDGAGVDIVVMGGLV